jgi:hypothetical protein
MLTTPDHDDAATSPPAFSSVGPKPQGFYLDCDSATGQEGTTFRAEEFNELILNLRQLVAAASVTGTKGDPAILQNALNRLFAGKGRAISATATLSPNDAGLILVDATAADVTLTLPAAAALADGRATYQFVRLDQSTHNVRIAPAGANSIRQGIPYLEAVEPLTLRSDGVSIWYPLSPTRTLYTGRTLNVSTTGVAQPSDPWGGQAFNSLASVFTYLAGWRLVAGLTIQIAAGTYTSTATLTLVHPDLSAINIVGAGNTATILRWNGVGGIETWWPLRLLKDVKVQGDALGVQCQGLSIFRGQGTFLENVIVEAFSGWGIVMKSAVSVAMVGVCTVLNCKDSGVIVEATASLTTAQLNLFGNGIATGAANIIVNGFADIDYLNTNGGPAGLMVNGGRAYVRQLNVLNSTVTTLAVLVRTGALSAKLGATAGLWIASQPAVVNHTIRADRFSYIYAGACMDAGTRAVTSPAVNTLGNVQAYIEAV